MTNLADVIGHELADDLYYTQTQDVEAAILENEPGVHRVALAVLADTNLNNPTGAFLYRLKQGQHRRTTRSQRNASSELSAVDRAETAYHAKIAHLNEHGALNDNSVEDAIAYAIDTTKSANDDTETALRQRLGIPPRVTAPPPEAWKTILHRLTTEEPQP